MKKGFTMVEMLVSFTIAAIVMVLLFNITLLIKSLYIDYGIRTELLIKQANILRSIEDSTIGIKSSITSCGVDCYDIVSEGKTYNLKINSDNSITFNKKKTKFSNTTQVKNIIATNTVIDSKYNASYYFNNSILTLRVEIYDSLLDENFDVVYTLPYNDRYVTVDTSSDTN